jgi:AcrR family transcriptional regulator
MGRRSDHSRDELEAMILTEGQRLMAATGFARFSAREVAKRIGYSVGTVTAVFGGIDGLVSAINARTFLLWAEVMEDRLDGVARPDRIVALVTGYFAFATGNNNLWSAIYEHRLPPDAPMPEALAAARTALVEIIKREIAGVLRRADPGQAATLSHSLISTVHGHCTFALNGSFVLLGEKDPLGLAIDRVREVLRAHGAVV